jgi:hypothetical protein
VGEVDKGMTYTVQTKEKEHTECMVQRNVVCFKHIPKCSNLFYGIIVNMTITIKYSLKCVQIGKN